MPKKREEAVVEDMVVRDDRKVAIKDAAIKDGFCHYGYEILRDTGRGDVINRKGSNVVHPDLIKSFERLNVHLAVIDDAFHYSQVEVDDIDRFHHHDITDVFRVTGIKIKGESENERVVLVGSKHITSSGRINLETPPISLTTSYKWYNELKDAVYNIVREVELYMDGKRDETVEDDNQMELFNQGVDFEGANV
ncbi:hypothetical protein JMG10_07725 [Nostoc ellipsosporum NOK]|nr:hypothetical protein [Nostoc ellipsosporum NOK]